MATPLVQRDPRRAALASPVRRDARDPGATRATARRHDPLDRTDRRSGAADRQQLRLVAGGRRALRFGVLVGVLLFGVMFAVTAFQTRLAENQLKVDQIEQDIAEQRARYDQLRLESATLRAPDRLVAEATAMGMMPGRDVEFVQADPAVVAAVLVSTAGLDEQQALPAPDPISQYGTVKAGVDGTP